MSPVGAPAAPAGLSRRWRSSRASTRCPEVSGRSSSWSGSSMGCTSVTPTCCASSSPRPRSATPAATVITFDHHPDEVLIGNAPPLLIDPEERLERLATAGVASRSSSTSTTSCAERPTTRSSSGSARVSRCAAFLMTPDAAFGFERRGTPDALAAMGERDGFEVVVVPPFDLHGRHVRSTEIRDLIRTGDLAGAAELAGATGDAHRDGSRRSAPVRPADGDPARRSVPGPHRRSADDRRSFGTARPFVADDRSVRSRLARADAGSLTRVSPRPTIDRIAVEHVRPAAAGLTGQRSCTLAP